MLEKRKTGKNILVACAVAAIMLVGGASAYFTATDEAENTWTVGSVDIDLQEPNYDDSDTENITPNQELDKDPQVENTGTNDAFIFVKFTIPKANVSTANENGVVNESQLQELFTYSINDGWSLVTSSENSDGNTYVYAYAAGGECTALSADDTTPVLFTDGKIKFKNIVEGQLGESVTIPVYAYGIQTSDITANDSTAPADVWTVLSNQLVA
ncbi:MAG: SipW-dependent-type signal peptide-containing protein [Clostridia bacterium]|nr:SipW-dependent-type signal peptide-containing protein [Clostridia bacterium]